MIRDEAQKHTSFKTITNTDTCFLDSAIPILTGGQDETPIAEPTEA